MRPRFHFRSLHCLGIETSCDETSVAIVHSSKSIKSLVTRSQFETHHPFKGIVPILAAEAHRRHLAGLIQQVLGKSGLHLHDIDLIAATRGPGMAPCLAAGLGAGKAIAAVLSKPFVGVHHMVVGPNEGSPCAYRSP
jgi:N6-L-threonylcarbamoyladenine synthase